MSLDDKLLEAKRLRARKLQEEVGGQLSATQKVTRSVSGGYNRGLAKVLGVPVDLMTAGLNLLPGVNIERPVGGSQQLLEAAGDFGLAPPAGEPLPSPFIGRIVEEIGGATVPFGAVGLAANTGAKGGMLLRPMLESFRQAPKAVTAAELSAAGGAGYGAAIANEVAPGNQMAEMGGQLVGGFLNPLSLAAAGGPAAASGARRALDPLLPGGAKRSAARQLQNVVDDPQAAARALSGPRKGVPGSRLTPAQETQDPGLLRLEQALRRSSPDFEQTIDSMAAVTNRAMRDQVADFRAPQGQTREFLQGRVQQISETIDSRIQQALTRTQKRIAALDPATPREQINRVAREELESALDAAKVTENKAWARVPKDVPVETTGIKDQFKKLWNDLPKAQKDDMPEVARQLLGDKGDLGDTEALGEVQGLRSKLGAIARNARAGDTPNYNQARLAEKLQDAALDAMEESGGGDAVKEALSISRLNAEKFRKGVVGKLLGSKRTGGQAISPESTLDAIFREGPEGAVRIEALARAAESPQMRDSIADFMRQRFVMQATDANGKIKLGVADKFIRTNREVLERLPDVKKELRSAKASQDMADRVAQRLSGRQKNLMNKQKSRAALYLDSPVEREVRSVLNSKDPVGNMRQLIRQVRKDNTGGALKGLKSQFVDELITQGQTGRLDVDGERRLSSQNLDEFLTKNTDIFKKTGLFSPVEVKRIEQITDTAKRLEKAMASGRNIDQVLDESPDALVDLVSRIVGANIGAQGAAGSTGAPLVAAGAGSRFMRHLTNRIPMNRTRDVLAQAVLDRDIMRDLLTKVKTPKQAEALRRRMNAWTVNLITDDEADGQQQQ